MACGGAKTGPALAVTYQGGDRELLEAMLEHAQVIEIAPDAIAASVHGSLRLRDSVLEEYASVKQRARFIAHSVGLSIGSFDRWNESYFALMDELFDRVEIEWHSDHLAFTHVAGENSGSMFALPRTQEARRLVGERIRRMQARYDKPFLLEHVVQLLPDPAADFTPAGFLNALVADTGCGIILDLYNIECDAHNLGFSTADFLDELDLSAVKEIHLAGGVLHDGFRLDIHSGPVADSTLELLRSILGQAPGLDVVTYEFLPETLPVLGRSTVVSELARLGEVLRS